ncbi:MAG: thioredoxin family protein [Candidatus Rokubacteria bacterium]|nr:thioredoxin family protein [Candidatus Rokubacteria bacterium]
MAQLKVDLDAARFSKGLSWKDYMAQMGDTRARTEENYQKTTLTDEERKFFGGITQVKYVLMMAENWCGDVHRNSPLMAHVAEAMPNAELRVFFRDQNLDLTDSYLNNGYRSIPIVVFFDKDFNEIGHWIERSAAATAKAAAIRGKTLDVAGADEKSKDAAMQEFRKQVADAYSTPGKELWREAVKEVKLIFEQKLGLAAAK